MQTIPLDAQDRTILGKKVKTLRVVGLVPAHVFGNKIATENVTVNSRDFLKVFAKSGESGLIDLKIGADKIRPVLVRDVQVHAVSSEPLHIDFYQVNLKESVRVTVPVVLKGDQPEIVRSGEAVVIQPMSEIEVEALPTELPENIEVDITSLLAIGDSIIVSSLVVPEGVTIHADLEAVVVKLDNAVTEEMQKLLEEQAAEQAATQEAAAAEAVTTEGGEVAVEGEAVTAGAEGAVAEVAEGEQAKTETPSEEKPQE
ncbi:MAG: 50S ribosomal protein L25 [Candidatus Daviesbacteria bacterium]|nr:50S ribosomal protein L25 [Candidatus Daviesbacteria bacterium]